MNEIKFNKTSNIFLDSGIVALHSYLEKFERNKNRGYKFVFNLSNNNLKIESDELFQLLEDLYFYMGKEIYDTSGKNARKKPDKYYFFKDPFRYEGFFKMKTYGLAALITNDPAPFSRDKEDSEKFKNIYEEDRDFALKITEVYKDKGMKLKRFDLSSDSVKRDKSQNSGDSKIYLNRPYTKTTRLLFDEKYFKSGNELCYLTGEGYEKLVDVVNTSPFIGGISNFNSFFNIRDQKISWKAMYLSRFAPKLALYSYIGKYEDLVCYFFQSDSLLNIKKIFDQNSFLYKDQNELIDCSYYSNFNLSIFSPKKGKDFQATTNKDFVEQYEILFMLIFTIYRQFLFSQGIEDIQTLAEDYDPLEQSGFKKIPLNLITFKAEKFSGTMRTSSFEYFNNFKFIIRLLAYLERNGVRFNKVLSSLKFLKSSDRNSDNKYRLQRIIRDTILKKVLFNKTIINDLERLFYLCYKYHIKNEDVGYKDYSSMMKFLELYEPITKYGGNQYMDKKIQERAIKLGSSIGYDILNFDGAETDTQKKANAKSGRRYIINLQKSRNLSQFNDAIIRIQNKYNLVVSRELLDNIDEQNFLYVKQFAIIGALNQINSVLNYKFKKGEDDGE